MAFRQWCQDNTMKKGPLLQQVELRDHMQKTSQEKRENINVTFPLPHTIYKDPFEGDYRSNHKL